MSNLDARLQELVDRQDIWQLILDYCRGVDRLDRELLLSVYHPDAIDDHGIFVGTRDQFVDWAIGFHSQFQTTHHHGVSNHSCEIIGDTAHCETYYHYLGDNHDAPGTFSMGRYIDRIERRDGKWAIAARVCVTEMICDLTPRALEASYAASLFSNGPATRDRQDVSYQRPLQPRAPNEGDR